MNRQYFLSLGGYDEGLLVWGGENFELSFKIWQCGGSILWVPCSHVGHVYRGFMPYSFGKLAQKKKGPLITIVNIRSGNKFVAPLSKTFILKRYELIPQPNILYIYIAFLSYAIIQL